jgi:preprotein translocase subunit YajC
LGGGNVIEEKDMRVSKSIMMGSAALLLSVPAVAFAQTATPTTDPAGTASGSAPATSAQQSTSGMQATPSGAQQATSGTASAGTTTLAQGATVTDTSGNAVGTIQSVSGDMVVLATSKSKVQLPKSSFAMGAKGPMIGMTAAQIDQAAAQASPQASPQATASATPAAKPNVVKGAAVADTQGGAVGTIEDVDAQFATVLLTTGSKVRLPVTAFGAGENGGLRVAMTAAQLSAAAGAATPSKGGA